MKVLHKVGATDNLEKLAKIYNCSVDEIVKINDLKSYSITDIDTIEIPQNKSDFVVIKNENKEFLLHISKDKIDGIREFLENKVVIASTNRQVDVFEEGDKVVFRNIDGKIYITKPLDTLKNIATKFGVREEVIIKNNNLKTNKLFIGQKLII